MRPLLLDARIIALGVTLTLAAPPSAFALRKSQETGDPGALATALRPSLPTVATGLEEGDLDERLKRWAGARFLLVDDGPGMLFALSSMLEDKFSDLKISATLVTAGTFDQAMALLDQEPYGVAILDYRLSGGRKGTEIAAHIRKQSPTTKIILHTANKRYVVEDEVPELKTLIDEFFLKGDAFDNLLKRLADLAPAAGLEGGPKAPQRASDAFL